MQVNRLSCQRGARYPASRAPLWGARLPKGARQIWYFHRIPIGAYWRPFGWLQYHTRESEYGFSFSSRLLAAIPLA